MQRFVGKRSLLEPPCLFSSGFNKNAGAELEAGVVCVCGVVLWSGGLKTKPK